MTSVTGGDPGMARIFQVAGRMPAWKEVGKHYNLPKNRGN